MGGMEPDEPTSDIVIFEDKQHLVEVRLEGETVWLSLQQLADLFERDKSVVSRHLKNIFDSGELMRGSVVAKNATTAADRSEEHTSELQSRGHLVCRLLLEKKKKKNKKRIGG